MRVSLRRLFASNNAGLHPPLQRKGHARTRALIEQVKVSCACRKETKPRCPAPTARGREDGWWKGFLERF